MASRRGLLKVFVLTRKLLTQPDNNFEWSWWEDEKHALAEIDPILTDLRSGDLSSIVGHAILFAPTGPLQETSLSSGWGNEFVELADAFDAALAAPDDCHCFLRPLGLIKEERSLGMDSNFGEVSLLRCAECGQQWVRYHYENEAFTGSGRWYLGAVEGDVELETGKACLESALEYFYGGSYFEGRVGLTNGLIHL